MLCSLNLLLLYHFKKLCQYKMSLFMIIFLLTWKDYIIYNVVNRR
nr:MAG TPA: hypothetical protein [Caudoviricetes sp.]DAI48296.1 MAG TPA: hypothetical protein [Caudoviricetes sp.]DAP04263.1 MAG TPA: hypothetical protein [Caudoviricetes sp.]